MAVTAADGIFGFAPMLSKTDLPATPKWYRHKASLVDIGVIDDQRVGPLEVGGGPFPTFPYKSGYVVGGGATFQPRLENVVGWLLHAAIGDVKSSTPQPGGNVHAEITVSATLPQAITTAITAPPATGSQVLIKVGAPVGVSMTATITVVGTDLADAALTGTYTVSAKVENDLVRPAATSVFKTITSINVTAGTEGDKFTPVFMTSMKHAFVPKSSSPSHVKYLAARKYIPQKDADAATDMWESYKGCKPLGFVLTLPNDSPVGCRLDLLGREFEDAGDAPDPAWTWENEFEDWPSIPVGCETGGAIHFEGGGIDADLPVVAAQVGWVNTPLDLRQERIFGDPMIEDVTIISRAMTYDCTVKWNNPDLYRAIRSGSKSALTWVSRPLTGSMLATLTTPGFVSGATKYQLEVSSPTILWAMNGTPVLAAGQAIMMRFTGTALLPTSGDYTTINLYNNVDSYAWPAA